MKTFNALLIVLTLLLLTFTYSCQEKTTSELIIGKWIVNDVLEEQSDTTDPLESLFFAATRGAYIDATFDFLKNNNLEAIFYNGKKMKGKYHLTENNKHLIINLDNEEEEYEIIEITKDKLTLKQTDDGDDVTNDEAIIKLQKNP